MAGVSKGAMGEILAARFLRDKGYNICSSNYRCRMGEIDIIATDKKYLVFAEVKTRREDSRYLPREAVTISKQRKLLQTAAMYMSRFPSDLQPRFDVIEVVTAADDSMRIIEINHIIGAYEAGDLSAAF